MTLKRRFPPDTIAQFTKTQAMAPDRIQVVGDPVEKKPSLRFEVRAGDLHSSGCRAEVLITQPLITEGDDLWFGWSTLFPQDFVASTKWAVGWQLHDMADGVTAGLQLHGENLSFRLMGSHFDALQNWSGGTIYKTALKRGVWTQYLLHVKFTVKTNGLAELFVDGKSVGTYTGPTLNLRQPDAYVKVGWYRDRSIPHTQFVYHRDIAIYDSNPMVVTPGPVTEVVKTVEKLVEVEKVVEKVVEVEKPLTEEQQRLLKLGAAVDSLVKST